MASPPVAAGPRPHRPERDRALVVAQSGQEARVCRCAVAHRAPHLRRALTEPPPRTSLHSILFRP